MRSLTLDPRATALVLIDLQHGIVSRQLAPHAAAQVVDNSAKLGRALTAAGGIVGGARCILRSRCRSTDATRRCPHTDTAGRNTAELVATRGRGHIARAGGGDHE